MECSHDKPEWFEITDSTAAYFLVRCATCKRIGMLGNVRDASDPNAPHRIAVQWATRVKGPPIDAAHVFVPVLRPGWTGSDGTFWYSGVTGGVVASIQYKAQPELKCWMVYCPPGNATPVQAPSFDEAMQVAEALFKEHVMGLRCVTCALRWSECNGDTSLADGHVHEFPEPEHAS